MCGRLVDCRVRDRIWIVLSCAVTSDSVFGRLHHLKSAKSVFVKTMKAPYYFSTHGCRRLVSCLLEGAFDEPACAPFCCRALRLKKSAIVSFRGGHRSVAGTMVKVKVETRTRRDLTFKEVTHRRRRSTNHVPRRPHIYSNSYNTNTLSP